MADRNGARKLNYQATLRDIAKSMVRLKRPERLLKIITRFIDRQFGLSHTSLLVLQEHKKCFIFVDSKGGRRFPIGLVKFEMDHPLVHWFQGVKKKRGAHKEDFLHRAELKKRFFNSRSQTPSEEARTELERVRKAMDDLKIELAIPGFYKDTLLGLLLLGQKKNNRLFTKSEISFFQILTQDCSMAVKTAEYHRGLVEQNQELGKRIGEIEGLRKKEQSTYYEIMRSLAQEVYAKDAYTFGHVSQVERLGLITAMEMGLDLSGKKRDILCAGLILHDVGKIGIPDHILKKAGRLEGEDWKIMQSHVEKGKKILEPLSDFKEAAEIVYCHHEKFDGSGYPRGLKGEEIPIEARIVSVVDAFHAIVSTRCYSSGKSVDQALAELKRCAGTQFDPIVVDAFVRALRKEMQKRGVDFFLDETTDGSHESRKRAAS